MTASRITSSILSPLRTAWRERQRDARFGRRLDARHDLHPHVAAQRARHARHELVPAAVEHRHRVADAEPQHARQVLRFVARQRDGLVAGIERRRVEAMHGSDYTARGARCGMRVRGAGCEVRRPAWRCATSVRRARGPLHVNGLCARDGTPCPALDVPRGRQPGSAIRERPRRHLSLLGDDDRRAGPVPRARRRIRRRPARRRRPRTGC